MAEFKFKDQQSDLDRLRDKVTSAMETGNTAQARLVVAEHIDTFPTEIATIRSETMKAYGVRL